MNSAQPSLLDPQPTVETPAPAVPVVAVQTIPASDAIATKRPDAVLIVDSDHPMAGYINPSMFDQFQRAAKLMSQSELVPAHYRGKLADVFIALQSAYRMRVDPMAFMQRSYVVQGKPGIEATLTIALINASGRFTGPLQWELSGTGKDRKAVCYAYLRSNGERVDAECSMAVAEAEGWTKKGGSKWLTIPDMMLRYRSATFFGRLYAPDVTMGFRTLDELEDIADAEPAAEVPRMGNAGTKAALGIGAAEGGAGK